MTAAPRERLGIALLGTGWVMDFHARAVLWNLQMAGALLFTIPVIIVFFFAQKVFVEGVTLTGVKG